MPAGGDAFRPRTRSHTLTQVHTVQTCAPTRSRALHCAVDAHARGRTGCIVVRPNACGLRCQVPAKSVRSGIKMGVIYQAPASRGPVGLDGGRNTAATCLPPRELPLRECRAMLRVQAHCLQAERTTKCERRAGTSPRRYPPRNMLKQKSPARARINASEKVRSLRSSATAGCSGRNSGAGQRCMACLRRWTGK